MADRRRIAWLLALAGSMAAACDAPPASVAMEPVMQPAPSASVLLVGTFVKLTDLPCHRSDPFVGGERVTFRGSDGSETTIVTHSANWIGRPADPPEAPLGQCRQVAPFEIRLPVAARYTVVINDHELRPVSLAELRAEGLRHVFRLPS